MQKELDFASALVEDISEAGLATALNSHCLQSHHDSTVVEIEKVNNSIIIREDGEQISEILISDDDFNRKFMETLGSSLNF